MFDIKDDAKGAYRRVELLTGPGRRRRWSAEEKARIVAESCAPDAVVSEVARRWQLCPQQLYGWRHEARMGLLASASPATGPHVPGPHVPAPPVPAPPVPAPPVPAFVPIVAEAVSLAPAADGASVDAPPVVPCAPAPPIEVELAGAVVRVRTGVDATVLAVVLRAVRASASPV